MGSRTPKTLSIDWSKSQMREDGVWVDVVDTNGHLTAVIPRWPLEHFAATAPDDIMETSGGLIGILEAAVFNAYAAGIISTADEPAGARILVVDSFHFPEGGSANVQH